MDGTSGMEADRLANQAETEKCKATCKDNSGDGDGLCKVVFLTDGGENYTISHNMNVIPNDGELVGRTRCCYGYLLSLRGQRRPPYGC